MINSQNIVKATTKNGKLKVPKLEEMYKHFFTDTFAAHNADADVMACAKCYFKLV